MFHSLVHGSLFGVYVGSKLALLGMSEWAVQGVFAQGPGMPGLPGVDSSTGTPTEESHSPAQAHSLALGVGGVCSVVLASTISGAASEYCNIQCTRLQVESSGWGQLGRLIRRAGAGAGGVGVSVPMRLVLAPLVIIPNILGG